MTATYTPKPFPSVVAVRLGEDLIVEAGNWVAIDPEAGTILSMTHEQFRAVYPLDGDRKAKSAKSGKAGAARTQRQVRMDNPFHAPKKVILPTPDRFCRMQGGRVLYVLDKLGTGDVQTKDVAAHLTADDAEQVSARLGDARSLGLVESRPMGVGNSQLWTITAAGRKAMEEVGFAAFTAKGVPVPTVP